jgi:hypothetical protein
MALPLAESDLEVGFQSPEDEAFSATVNATV